ncbi:DNA polymerase IV [uncultured Veillonella sp.]|uniref:DNA polymerase IV n=1 Tax=uncultured Veillonella sp. TaxID=159268 RepID=UPI0025E275FA|nr:DNA polymerase IV [uncultured Veillonella sp.]
MRRWIMHVDMDAFFASVEQLDHPEYKGHPVIVGGLSSRGVVATASYEARKFGVHSAMPISRAKKLCPQGIFVYPNMARYKEISHVIHKVMEEFTPLIEPLSLDEAFLDVTGITHKFTGPKALGRAIKNRVFEETGLIISAGLAPNKFLAKLASDLDKPDGLVVIPYGKECESLANLPIKRIWGVGPSTERRLKHGGFLLIKDIQALSDEKPLVPYVGNQARRIWELARGIDERPVEPDRQIQSVGNEETYESDVEDPAVIDLELHYFANRVAKRLRKYGLMGHTVSIKVRYNDFKTVSRQKRLDSATDQERIIYDTSVLLWNKLMRERTGVPFVQVHTSILDMPVKPIRLLGVTVSGLSTEGMVQEDLFTIEADEKEEKLSTVLDSLASKFGEGAIMSGALWRRAHGDGGERRKRSELKTEIDVDDDNKNLS